jgi:hypothetical protein
MIKHFIWEYRGETGRVAVRVESDVIEVQQVGGKAPPWGSTNATAVDWSNVLNTAFRGPNGEPLRVYARNLSATRCARCAVERRTGMSGAVNYTLRIERNAKMADYPIAACLHVSMAGKLNDGLRMWLGDWAELNNALLGDVDDDTPESGMTIREARVCEGLNFYQPEPWPEPSSGWLAELYEDLEA